MIITNQTCGKPKVKYKDQQMDQTITNTWHAHTEGGGKEKPSPQRLWKQYLDQIGEGQRKTLNTDAVTDGASVSHKGVG